ncbi:MAG: hypothetical protein HY842_15315 [Bacteroidetes bacterium]|nr:hypothetical protein [Bacteroidota bacterium]
MKIASILTLLALPLVFFAQSEAIKNLEKTTAKLSGEDFLKNARTLSEWHFNENFFEKSAEWAEKGFDAAKKSGLSEQAALFLNQQGTALMKAPSRRNNFKSKAFKSFEESNSLTTDKALRLDNLLKMKDLALTLDKRKDLTKILKDIAVLQGDSPASTGSDEGGLFANRKKAIEQAQQQNRQLSAAVNSLSQEKANLAAQQENLRRLIALKETAIQNMTAEQMRQQLLFSVQERIVDSLKFAGAMDSMELSQKEMVVEQQQSELLKTQAELDLRKSQRNLLLAVVGLAVLLGGGLFYRYHFISKHNAVLLEKNKIIEMERKRSEELLLNILPSAIAEELKKNGTAEARHYKKATVLFTDFKGFSEIAKKVTPEKLVADLDFAFTNFDRIIGKFGLEKIKTIGDAYMCAGGLPDLDGTHPRKVVLAALEIQQFLTNWNEEKKQRGEPAFEARIGIHTGPLVAGVVGSKKFAYDIWGDTVNVAARMESSGEVGLVNISASTFSFVKNDFNCEYRGKVAAKNVGEVEMYYVREVMLN